VEIPQTLAGAAMHGINLSNIPELENGSSNLAPETPVRGTRNLLPLSESSMFGAGKDPMELRSLMRKLSARISREPERQDEDNPCIPSGYTYLLQFIAHDLVNTSVSLAATSGRRFGFENIRQQPLTLDTIYGGGPDVSPQAYEFSIRCIQSHGLMPRTRLRTGRVQDRSGSTEGMPFADIGRATPVDVRDDGFSSGTLARRFRTEALVADPRNEDHALIAQITWVFHQMHNFVLEQFDAGRPPVTAPDAYRNFICARFVMTLMYRRIVILDVLRRLLNPSVFRYYFVDKKPLVGEGDGRDIPLEFSHGAFRCGHAMVRNRYRVNSEDALETARALQICSRRSPGFVPLSEQWVIQWKYFFELDRTVRPNFSRRLRPNFSPIARSEFFFAPLLPKVGDRGDAAGLPNRDLVSAVYARLWSVPKLIDSLRARSVEISNFLPAYQKYASGLTDWLRATANPHGISEQFGPGDIPAIVDDPPLPFFVLHEASLRDFDDGKRLGPLGSIIVAETIRAAMAASPMDVDGVAFDAYRSFKEQFGPLTRLGATDKALQNIPDIENLADLLSFMQSEGLFESRP
jgi:hypothetical protein